MSIVGALIFKDVCVSVCTTRFSLLINMHINQIQFPFMCVLSPPSLSMEYNLLWLWLLLKIKR